jgi:hypothetical protein
MWQHHLIILGVLVALLLPVYLLDYFLLRPSGDIFLINLRTMLISFYAAWLAVHVPVSSLALYLLKTDRLYTLHGIAAVASVGLLVGGLKLNDRIEAAQFRAKHEARMKVRQGLVDTIALEKWWYVPGPAKPEAIGAVFVIARAGRLAASVRGFTAPEDGKLVYLGEMKPQKQVKAGERIEYVFPLKYYSDEAGPDVRFTFRLFERAQGPAAGDIFKTYSAIPERKDDGEYFRDILPPPVEPAQTP